MMTNSTNNQNRAPKPWARLFLFVLFLVLLAMVLKGMGWCIGGVCDVGVDLLLK